MGVTGGLNLSFFEKASTHLPLLRYNAGIKTSIPFDKFYIASELKYSVEGWRTSLGKMKLHYIDIQLLAGHFIAEKLSFELGGEYGYLLKARRNPRITFFENYYEKHNVSAIIGIRHALSADININLRYIHGLSYLSQYEIIDMDGNVIRVDKDGLLRVLQLSCSYYFL